MTYGQAAALCFCGWIGGWPGGPAAADSLVASHILPAQSVIGAGDVLLVQAALPQALELPSAAIGMQTRITIQAGHPIRARDLTPPTLVERNALVELRYSVDGLTIRAQGRALARGAAGEEIRVMNLTSKATLSGIVGADGVVRVGG